MRDGASRSPAGRSSAGLAPLESKWDARAPIPRTRPQERLPAPEPMRTDLLAATLLGAALGDVSPLPWSSSEAFPDARAGTAIRLDLEGAFRASDLVIEGRVLGARAAETPDGMIVTDFDVRVDRTFWGEPAEARTIRLPGGVLPSGKGMVIPGMPRLAVGEDVVLMLEQEGPAGTRVQTGLAQGKYRVVTSPAGERLAVPAAEHIALVDEALRPVGRPRHVLDHADLVARLEALRQEREQAGAFAPAEDR